MRRFVLLSMTAWFVFSIAAPAAEFQKSYYIKMGLGRITTSYIFDEGLTRLPESPRGSYTSMIDFSGQDLWLLATEFHVWNRTADGEMQLKDDDPCYTRMNDHMVMSYVSPNKPPTESFMDGQRVISAGQEFSDLTLPKGYGYRIKDGYMYVWDYHYHNKCGLPSDAEVFIEVRNRYDDDPNAYYQDTNVFWYDAGPGSSEFCVDAGPFYEPRQYDGYSWPGTERRDQSWRVVAVGARMHDHSVAVQFVRNEEALHTFTNQLGDIYSYHQSHNKGCDSTPWHRHEGHLMIKSIDPWYPEDLVLQGNDRVMSRSFYTNPHDTTLDAVAILVVFFAFE